LVSFDFNVEPMTATISQQLSVRKVVMFDYIKINVGSTEEVCEQIQVKFPQWNGSINVTGDATGRAREKARRGNISSYKVIKDMLRLKEHNLQFPTMNMAHRDSRQLCCAVCQHAEFFITDNCAEVIGDCKDAAVDDYGELIKTKEQGRHFFDNVRYTLHTLYPDFISNPTKYR